MAGASRIVVTLPGGRRVDAQVGHHVVRTDQPQASGGEDTAPTPFQLFLASIGTCAGIFVQGFCAKRGIPFHDIRVVGHPRTDAEGTLVGVELEIQVPPSFPEKYRDALVNVAGQCSVKRAIQAQPEFQVRTVVAG